MVLATVGHSAVVWAVLNRSTVWLDLALVALIVALALPTRLAVVRAYSASTAALGAEALQSEERLYNRYAVPWAKGEGAWPREKAFPWHPLGSFTHRPPAYTLFLGLVYRAAGSENFAAVRELQAWLDTFTALLVYAAGVLAFGGAAPALMGRSSPALVARAIGFTAAVAVARYDFLEQMTSRLLSETLFTFLGMAFVVTALAAVRAEASPRQRVLVDRHIEPGDSDSPSLAVYSPRSGVQTKTSIFSGHDSAHILQRGRVLGIFLAGYLLGWANLTRPFLLPAALVFPVWAAMMPEPGPALGRRVRSSLALSALLGLALAILPVTWRNWQFHHKPILISSNSGFTVFNSVLGTPGLSHPDALGSEEDVDALELGELAEQAEFRRRALDYLARFPEDWPRIFGEKLRTLTASAEGHKISHVLLPTPNDAWLYPLVLAGALASLVVLPRLAWHPRLLLAIVAASQLGTSLLTKAELRYRVPIVPVLALATAWAVWTVLWTAAGWLRGRVRPQIA